VKFPAYRRYKPTGVDWLGEVPEHWAIKRLKFAARTIMGQSPSSDIYTDNPAEQPFLQGNAEFGARFPAAKWFCNAAPKRVPVGALLLSVRAPVGALNEADRSYAIGRGLCAVVCNDAGIHKDFGWYALQLSRNELNARATGSTYDAVSAADVGDILLALPPFDEQRAVAAFLDRETGRVDRLVAKKGELIERLKEKRSALISRIVTRGLPPAGARAAGLPETTSFKPSGLEWLGDIPTHWKVGPLKSLAKSGRRTFTDGDWVELPFITDEGVRLIQTGNVGIGTYREQGFRYISEASFTALRCTDVMPEDVLICRLDGPVGRACLAPDLGGRMITSVDNTILKPRCDVSPRFIVYLLSSAPWLSWIDALCRVGGGFRMRISRTMLGNIRVPIPTLREQRAVAAYLDAETAELDALVAKVELALERLQEYRIALVTAAVTGKVDVRREVAA
jgi:type I restriction enzyme, S subunit